MQEETNAVLKIALGLFDMDKLGINYDELSKRLVEGLKSVNGIDDAKLKLVLQKKEELLPLEEYAINMAKQYRDNRLSSYSEFGDLVSYYNQGYKSSMVIPIIAIGKRVGVITLLSRKEEYFSDELASYLNITVQLFGLQLMNREENAKNVSLAKYFDAAFNATVPQLIVDRKGYVVKANKSANMLGIAAKALSGMNIKEILDIDSNMLETLKNGVVGTVRSTNDPFRIFAVSQNSVNENVMHVVINEITDKKIIEEQKTMLAKLNNVFLMLDSNTNIIAVEGNPDLVMKSGRESLLGRKLADMIKDKEAFGKLVETARSGSGSGEFTMLLDNNISIDTKIDIFKNGVYGISCIVSPLYYERYTKRLEENIDDIIKSSSDIIIIIDQFGYVKRVNKSTLDMLGYNEQEIVGTAISSLYYADAAQKIENAMSMAKQNGSVSNLFMNMKRNGTDEVVPFEQSIRKLVNESNELSGYMIVGRELATKRVISRMEDEIERITRDAEKFKSESDLKTQFIYNISHDLKTPITNIKGFSKLLYNGDFGELNGEQKNYLQIIADEADRLLSLIQQILDVAKLSSGKIKLDMQQVDIKKLVENPSITALKEVAEGKGLMFGLNVEYNLPTVTADPNRLIQVFVNLINNAIKFTEKGSIMLNIYKKGKSIRVEVKDTGIGISKEEQRRLFRKFYQVQHKGLVKQEGAGTGLGLSIAKEIINLHGGKIGIISELGKGSTFWFTIPLVSKKRGKQ
ncbi:MAG: ATP-binding protein [Candidatus Micrarchaeia archaeon]